MIQTVKELKMYQLKDGKILSYVKTIKTTHTHTNITVDKHFSRLAAYKIMPNQ